MSPESVIAWREAMTRLADQYFFDLLRMYLGAIKTPFNKQRLIEELSAFLRKKSTKRRILESLDAEDLLVVAAVREIQSPTQQRIVSLLSPSSSFSSVYERVLNLEERLIIYRKGDEFSRAYAVNPLLEDELAPYANRAALFYPLSRGTSAHAAMRVDDLVLAALYGVFLLEGDSVKNDGTLRKKTMTGILERISRLEGNEALAALLVTALRNLSLLTLVDGRLVPDSSRWQAFAQGTPQERVAYVAAAATGRHQRERLQRAAQGFIDYLSALEPGARYDEAHLRRLSFLISEREPAAKLSRARTRFSSMIGDDAGTTDPAESGGVDYTAIALLFGALVDRLDGTFERNEAFFDTALPSNPSLVVSPTFEVIVFPGLPLSALLPLVAFLEVRDVQTAGQFVISRRSCTCAFDLGLSAEQIASAVSKVARTDLPGNVSFTVADWYRNYSSVSLYHGYVLRVDEGRRAVFERNEQVSPWIAKVLAPGVYLLALASEEDLAELCSRAGLDFVPSVSTPPVKPPATRLPSLCVGPSAPIHAAAGADAPSTEDAAEKLASHPAGLKPAGALNAEGIRARKSELLDHLGAMEMDADVREALASRIERKIILTPEQIDPDSVRVEKIEARGMDFLGKVRIAESAYAANALLEIKLDDKDGGGTVIGRPIALEKRPGDLMAAVAQEGSTGVIEVSLGRAALVRRIRGSIFAEPSRSRD